MSRTPQEPHTPSRGRDTNMAEPLDRAITSSPTPPTIPDSSRRALVGSAIDSIQRFKQSWKSIMFLKAGIGLGQVSPVASHFGEASMLIVQVVVLVVLLILASVLPSPLYPDSKQIDDTDACPHPGLFQAWMIVQIFRLTVCWSVSCWVAIRAQRALRQDSIPDDQEAANRIPTYVPYRFSLSYTWMAHKLTR